ncbi:MAG TPA: phage tail protein [Flavobacteriaceae bacterium]|nr:phage tail protein [Flavobacteriaceae bacterium]MCB9214029.1 phage tail protein [Alteromonas sp.]HPF10826.1 phage tail protein [Flavobacteriaceae bacterium]HQU20965.1 phage tail protein [Flavobacteriaceae bacterium]HQU65546.1 phage tail protein [Flavobacteriaceae bacterium]
MDLQSKYPVSFYFKLSFKGEDAAFQEVSGISKELSVEEVVCGGENRFKYRLPTTASGQNLVLKRAIIPEGSELIDWCSSTIDEGLANPITAHDVSVSLLDEEGMVLVSWTFYNAYPVKYSVSDLKSNENALAIETIELAYTYFEIAQEVSGASIANLFT